MRRQSCLHTLVQILILALLPLAVSSAELALASDNYHYVQSVPTATPSGRVRVVITKTKAKLHFARQQRPAVQLALEDDDTDYYDELPDIQVGYRRPELFNQTADIELSDEIKLRLALARLKALKVYNQTWQA